MYAERLGKPRWGDKTPIYCRHLELVERLLPEARFVHVVRDGRDVAVSLRRQWFSPGDDMRALAQSWCDHAVEAHVQGLRRNHYVEIRYESLILETESVLRRLCDFLDLAFEPSMLRYFERAPSRLEEHRARRRADGSMLVTREQRLKQQSATMQPPDPARAGCWKAVLSEREVAEFEEVAGSALIDFGYRLASR
jgi:hypothetical protein